MWGKRRKIEAVAKNFGSGKIAVQGRGGEIAEIVAFLSKKV